MHPRNELRLLAGIAIDPSLEITVKPTTKKLTESGWSSQELVTNLDDAYARLADAVERRDQQEITRINAELEELESWQQESNMGLREGKKSKKAKKDYDGDGKVESEAEEHKGVVAKAIKKSKKKGKKSEKVEEGEKFTGYAEWEQEAHTVTNSFVHFEDAEDGSGDRVNAVADNPGAGGKIDKDGRVIGIWDDSRGEGIIFESTLNYHSSNQVSWEDDEAEPINVSGKDAQDDNTVWEPLDSDKNESPAQLDSLGNQSSEEHDQTITIPAKLLTQLLDVITGAKEEADKSRNSYSRYETTKFYDDYANACQQLHDHLKGGTVGDMKKAQIHMSSLMGPMLHKIPDDVSDFVMRGGQNRSLKDHFFKVQGYPIEGPRNKLS